MQKPSTDIVLRLQTSLVTGENHKTLISEAADEILRLRYEIALLKSKKST